LGISSGWTFEDRFSRIALNRSRARSNSERQV
jgi:hypothetical protein